VHKRQTLKDVVQRAGGVRNLIDVEPSNCDECVMDVKKKCNCEMCQLRKATGSDSKKFYALVTSRIIPNTDPFSFRILSQYPSDMWVVLKGVVSCFTLKICTKALSLSLSSLCVRASDASTDGRLCDDQR